MRKYENLLYNEQFDELNNIVRWAGMNKIKDETVGQHSFVVSWLARILSEEIFTDDSPKLLSITYATFHDFNEYITGDMNHNVKYNDFNGQDLRKSLNEYITHVVDCNFPKTGDNTQSMLNYLLKDEVPNCIKKLVKLCDWMSMVMYLNKEMNLGNTNVILKLDYCEKKMATAAEECIIALESQIKYKINCEILKT
jgi:5'-deoxynucleotidase YfbR-like HD superfamily hydrolase